MEIKEDKKTLFFWDMFPKTVIGLPVFTHLNPSQAGPVTRHLVLSAERHSASGFQNKSSTGASLWDETKAG